MSLNVRFSILKIDIILKSGTTLNETTDQNFETEKKVVVKSIKTNRFNIEQYTSRTCTVHSIDLHIS